MDIPAVRSERPDGSDRPIESVWDYPRPPAVVPDGRLVEILFDGVLIASTTNARRVLETSHPPSWYLPSEDIADGVLEPGRGHSICEWKGNATYWDVVVGDHRLRRAAWSYPDPLAPYATIAGHVAFYPTDLTCTVDGEPVLAQDGGFYGGWITPDVEGPFKGAPGTLGW